MCARADAGEIFARGSPHRKSGQFFVSVCSGNFGNSSRDLDILDRQLRRKKLVRSRDRILGVKRFYCLNNATVIGVEIVIARDNCRQFYDKKVCVTSSVTTYISCSLC